MNADTVLDWALQTGLAVSILVVFILCVRRPITRRFGAAAAYALWLLPLIRLFMPAIPLPAFLTDWVLNPPKTLTQPDPIQTAILDVPLGNVAATSGQSNLDVNNLLITAWLAIAGLWFGYQILRHLYQIRSLRLKTDPVSADMKPVIETAMTKLPMAMCPEIRMSQDGLGPMVTRFWRPMIILPQDFMEQYTPEQQSFALVHEMAHVKRLDLWAAFAVLMYRALNWPNPLMHYAAHKFRADQEAACDAYLLNKLGGSSDLKQNYARTLIKAAKHMPRPATNAPLGLALSEPVADDIKISKGEKR